jgi:hypothetical protein
MVIKITCTLHAMATAIIVLALLPSGRMANAADPTMFGILTTQAGKIPEIHPNDELRLRIIDGDLPFDPAKVKLWIGGSRLNVEPTIQDREVVFQLSRNDQNRAFWARLLGPALDKRKTLLVGIEVNDKALKYRPAPGSSDESPQQKIDLVPAEPTTFAVVTSQKGELPKVTLKGEVRIGVDGDTPLEEGKIQLRIDGELLNVVPRILDGRELVFPLVRSDKNRSLWSRLLGSPFSKRDPAPVSLEVGGKPLKYTESPKDGEAPKAGINVIAYNGWLMTLGIAGVLLIVLASLWFAACTTLIRDTLFPQIRLSDRSFSLGRLQMLVWFCVIISSFVFIFVVTFDLNSITAESFVLMGISASTALASVAIERSKTDPAKDPVQNAQAAIASLGIKTAEEADALFKANASDPTKPATAVIPDAKIAGTANPTVGDLWTKYDQQIADFRSRGLLQDLVNDRNGPTIHRWQILIWTAVLAAIYVGAVYASLETPTFGTNLLALMGISGGVYLGFKIPEKQS